MIGNKRLEIIRNALVVSKYRHKISGLCAGSRDLHGITDRGNHGNHGITAVKTVNP